MAEQARTEMGVETLDAVADRGYYEGEEILACETAGITVTLPKPMTSSAKAAGRFGKQDFVYVAADDVYRCPAGERLTYRYTNEENGKTLRRYWTTSCQTCALKAQCTPGKERRISRWEHEAVLKKVQQRLDRNPDKSTAPSDCGASLRDHKGLDGCDALPDADATEGRDRDGAARARLQHETRDEDSWRWRIDGGNPRMRGTLLAPLARVLRLKKASGACTDGFCRRGHADPPNPRVDHGSPYPSAFSHSLGQEPTSRLGETRLRKNARFNA
jgi:hypothetical protein